MNEILCMDCGCVMNTQLLGRRRKRCVPCGDIARRTIYEGISMPNKRDLIRHAKQKEDDSYAKRGHLEAFMGLDYPDQII